MSDNQLPAPSSDSNAPLIAMGIIAVIVLLGFGIALFASERGDKEDTPDTNDTVTQEDDNLDGIREFDPPQALQDFTFTSTEGEPVSLSDFAGRYVLLYFGYLNCPDFCPTTMLEYEEINTRLGDNADEVVLLFIGIDEARDTPEALANYVSRYDADIIALSANAEELERIGEDYELNYLIQPETAPNVYNVDHTVSKFLINPDGELIRIFSWGLSEITITRELENLLEG